MSLWAKSINQKALKILARTLKDRKCAEQEYSLGSIMCIKNCITSLVSPESSRENKIVDFRKADFWTAKKEMSKDEKEEKTFNKQCGRRKSIFICLSL